MGIKDSQELKQLQSRKGKLETKIKHANQERLDIEERLKTLRSQLSGVVLKIKNIAEENKEVVVSEHAMLRYLERTMGVDMDQIKQEILTDSVKEQNKVLGSGKFPTTGNCRAIIKDGVVVTVTKRK